MKTQTKGKKRMIICGIAAMLLAGVPAGICAQTENSNKKERKNMENVLTNRQRHMVTIANLEAKGDLERLAAAINEGLDDGLTVSEIREALSQLYAYTGFPRSLNALGTLQRVLDERHNAGKTTAEGREADPMPAGYDALKQGTEVQTRLCGGTPFNYTFAPATDYYLKAHLFGDIFARNNLTYADRELVTVSALAGMDGVEPQLRAHVDGARNMGLSDAEIRSVPDVLCRTVGRTEAHRAAAAIAAVMGEKAGCGADGCGAGSDGACGGAPVLDEVFAMGEPNTAYAKYFIGNSYLAPLASGEGKLGVANVTFEPRCRNNWHVHHRGGQILICVSGRGWYQEWGKPARELRPGDVVDIPAEAKHWHGAAADSWFQHIAIGVPAEGATTEWLEAVEDAEYDKLK